MFSIQARINQIFENPIYSANYYTGINQAPNIINLDFSRRSAKAILVFTVMVQQFTVSSSITDNYNNTIINIDAAGGNTTLPTFVYLQEASRLVWTINSMLVHIGYQYIMEAKDVKK